MSERSVKFEIEGEPVPKGRPRVNTETGRAYTPGRTKAYEDVIGYRWNQLNEAAFEGPLTVYVDVAESTKQRAGDLDNYCKIALDALNGLAFKDDKQVEALYGHMLRKYDQPHLIIEIVSGRPDREALAEAVERALRPSVEVL